MMGGAKAVPKPVGKAAGWVVKNDGRGFVDGGLTGASR